MSGSLRIFFLRSLSSLSLSILNCIIFIIIISTRSRGGSGATRSHKAAAPASVEQTECGSKMSYGWCHRFQRFHEDDVTDFKDFNDVPWMMSQISKISKGWCHRVQRFQKDDVTDLKILQGWGHRVQRFHKDDVTDFKDFNDVTIFKYATDATRKMS